MTWQNKLFLIFWTAVTIVLIGIMAILYVSLIPHFSQIGIAFTALLILAIACAGCFLVAFTYNHIKIMIARRQREQLHRQLVTFGEVVAYMGNDGAWTHLSAEHERAKVIPQVEVKQIAAPKPIADKETVLELFNKGIGLRTIAESTGLTYYQVQKITSEAKKEVID